MAGEMGWRELARGDKGEGYVLHHAIADHIGGVVHPFDQYQGPYILAPDGTKLWIQGEMLQVFNERTDEGSWEFPMYRANPKGGEPIVNTQDAVDAALNVYDMGEENEKRYTLCMRCDHFIETDEQNSDPGDDADEHLYDGDQEFDHSPVVGYETHTLAYWKARRPDLFEVRFLADGSKATGPNAYLYRTYSPKGADERSRRLETPMKRLRDGQHDTQF